MPLKYADFCDTRERLYKLLQRFHRPILDSKNNAETFGGGFYEIEEGDYIFGKYSITIQIRYGRWEQIEDQSYVIPINLLERLDQAETGALENEIVAFVRQCDNDFADAQAYAFQARIREEKAREEAKERAEFERLQAKFAK